MGALVVWKEDNEKKMMLYKKRAQYESAWGTIEKIKEEGGVFTVPVIEVFNVFFFSSRGRHTIFDCDWSSDVCSSDLAFGVPFCRGRHLNYSADARFAALQRQQHANQKLEINAVGLGARRNAHLPSNS